MADNSKVSVIVLTYNLEKSVVRALDSILSQKTNFPFEIILSDDFSTDKTIDIIKKYAKKHPDIIKPIFSTSNTGFDQNYRRALKAAKSEYTAYCDGDDYWCNDNKLQIAVDTLDQNQDCVMFVHDTIIHDIEKKTESNMIPDYWKKNIVDSKFSLTESIYTHMSARVHRRMDLPNGIDTFMYQYVLSKGLGYYYDDAMSVYNYHGNGTWSSLSSIQQEHLNHKLYYDLNICLKFKYDDYYTALIAVRRYKLKLLKIYKTLFGKRFGWYVFIKLESCYDNIFHLFTR